MRLCSCGFANPDDAMRCAACGGAFSHESAGDTLLLEDVRSGEVVRIPAPGGILGRAGDFSPDLFSPRVSGVHAVVAVEESDAQDAPAETAWSVRCPVCGTEYAVEGPEGRVAACTFCKDPLDARQIARVAARAMSGR